MIEYEVTLDVEAGIADDFLVWLRGHIDDMIALPGFTDATLHALDTDDVDRCSFCVRYRLTSRVALDAYFRDHAEGMRADGIRRFGDAMRASRRILSPLV